MARRKLTARGRGPDAQATVSVEACRGKVWLTVFDCPFTAEAIFEPAQAASLVELIGQATREGRATRTVRRHEPGGAMPTIRPTGWVYLRSENRTIRWRRGDDVAYVSSRSRRAVG